MNEQFFIYNNNFYTANSPVISAGNRGLRYGDGLFETMKSIQGKIINIDFHFDRLFSGLALLQFDIPKTFTDNFLLKKIQELCIKNQHKNLVRIRLMIFRGNGGIFDPENHLPNYILETSELTGLDGLNQNGLVIDIFQGAKKSCDGFSNIKSNNYLPYLMAGLHAKQNKLNDCLLLNSYERISDSTIANIFIIKGNNIYTPPLSEGCVAGVMRRWMLEKFNLKTFQVTEKSLSLNDLLEADECFFTNSIYYMRWVRNFRSRVYGNTSASKIYQHIIQTIEG